MITLKDIARETGLNFRSVSQVLRDDPRYNAETRQRVRAAANRMGYVPHSAGRRLARERSDSCAQIFDQVGLISLTPAQTGVDWVCQAMMGGAERELSQYQASLVYLRVSQPADWKKVERMTRAGGVDGWLLYGPVTDEDINRLKAAPLSGVPYLIVGDHRCTQPVSSVSVDNQAAGRLAVEHLASLGHRRIALLDGQLRFAYQEQMLAGFREAIRELGLDDDDRLIVHDDALWELSGLRLLQWFKADLKPTAVFVPEVDMAIEFSRTLKEAQIEVPNELSIVTADPISILAKSHGFTRIELPLVEVARRGADLLHRIASETLVERHELKISPSLVQGWSTCPPRNELDTGSGTKSTKPTTNE